MWGGHLPIYLASSWIFRLSWRPISVGWVSAHVFIRCYGVTKSLPVWHCRRLPSNPWNGQPAVARRYIISLIWCLVTPLRYTCFLLGLPWYLMSVLSSLSVHSCRMFSLRLFFPCSWPNVLLIMMEIPDLRSHISDQFVFRLKVLALRPSRLCLYLVYRSSGAIPSSVHIACVGVFFSRPKALRTICFRVVWASLIRPACPQVSILYVS